MLEKLEIENKVSTKITYPNRVDTPRWNRRALREAVINAFVHNDYTTELSPTFEIYPNRLEIRSFGRLPETMSKEEFFTGTSMPKNKELMRIFSDIELVESLGMGIPRIVEAYGRECFTFSDNFIKMTLPTAGYDSNQDSNQDDLELTPLAKAVYDYLLRERVLTKMQMREVEQYLSEILSESISILRLRLSKDVPQSKTSIFKELGITSQKKNSDKYLQPLIDRKMILPTIKDKPTSRYQKYAITGFGRKILWYFDESNLRRK